MKPDYKNWVPKGMVVSMLAGAAAMAVLLAAALIWMTGTAKTVTAVIAGVLLAVLAGMGGLYVHLYRSFSYDGKKQLSRRIIDGVSGYVVLPKGGIGLDVGCGSGALTIACARKNPGATMVGLDRWGKEYASFNLPLCQSNARAEGVEKQVTFLQGDACKLPFPDGEFDAVTSNYCYHNIPVRDRQSLILETLRVLKKGGSFAIHDEFTRQKYGDLDGLLQKLRDLGYEKAELLDTAGGLFLTAKEAGSVLLQGSRLLVGIK